MQRTFKSTMLALLALAMIGFAAPAAAQDGVFVVNMQQVWAETSLGQDLGRQLSEVRDEIQTRLTARSEELQSEMTDLQRQRDEFIITDEVYEERANVLRQQFGGMQNAAQQAEQYLNFAGARAQEAFGTTIQDDLISVLEAHDGAALLEMSNTIVWSDQVDVTAEVVQLVNGHVTELDLQPWLTPPEAETEE